MNVDIARASLWYESKAMNAKMLGALDKSSGKSLEKRQGQADGGMAVCRLREHMGSSGGVPPSQHAPARQGRGDQTLPPGVATQLAEIVNNEREAACQNIREQSVKQKMAACEKIALRLQAGFRQEKQQLIRQHKRAMAEAKEMTARRDRDQKQFAFTVRGHETPELSGSVPCNIFEAELASVLNKKYNGEWAYAKDDRGRACINSDPAHWPLILRWLSYGAVPDLTKCTSDFIAECRYWQLNRLLTEIEQLRQADSCQFASPGAIAKTDEYELEILQYERDGHGGFKVKGERSGSQHTEHVWLWMLHLYNSTQ